MPTEPDSSDSPIKLSRHMTFAVVVPVLMLVMMGALLAWQISRMGETATWVNHTNEVIAKLNEVRVKIGDKESSLRGYLLTKDPDLLGPFHTALPEGALRDATFLTRDNPVQQAKLYEASGALAAWSLATEQAVAADAGGYDKSLLKRIALVTRLRTLLEASIAHEETLLVQRTESNTDADRSAKLWFIGLLGLSALGLAFVSRRQLGLVTSAFTTLVGTERAAKITSRQQGWIRGGEAAISSAVVGEGTIAEVAQRGLDALAAYAGAVLGAIYQLRGNELVRIAGVALPAGSVAVLPADKGLLGSVIQARRLQRIKDADAQIAIEGGVAKTQTVEVVLIPAIVAERVIGAIALGFSGASRDGLDEMLGGVGTTIAIAIAIRGAEQRARNQELLEETQRQGEELQTQHEELRVTNEELEQQGTQLREAHLHQQNIQHELEAANANLEEQTATLEQQREELLRTQADLEQHAADLSRASQYKSDFLARMSHELRTPLNSTLILARLLGDNASGNLTPEQTRFAETIYSAGNDLLVLINDILDLAKIEAGRLELRLGSVSLERVRDTLTREFEPLAKGKQLSLAVEVLPGVPAQITTDEQRLVQVLRNLVSNACKFTERGSVRVQFRAAADRIEVAVTDTGIGIPGDQLEAVFEAFHQVDGSVSRRHGGTGLGLAISRDLAQLLGGRLALASTPGQGSTFTFDIPLAPPAQTARTASHDAPIRARPTPSLRSTGMNRIPTPPPPAASGFDDRERLVPNKRTMLVIEDDIAFAAILRDLGRELDYQVVHAATADEGVELAMRHRPDGILLDVNLPDHSGLSVLERLKRQPAIRHVPIHMLSVEDHSRRSLELGAVGYLLKPANRDELVGAIKRIEDRTSQRVRRLLVVEDDAVQADAVRALLGGASVEITTVPSKAEALKQLASVTFDCVVMDLKLSDGTGFELLETMTNDDRITFPPVIIYTGKSLTHAEEERLRHYSTSIIVKGARSPERLLDEVTLFLHQVESDMPQDRQRVLREVRNREALFEGKTVLIVEDDVRNVFALSSVLEPRGLKTVISRNGREALEVLDKEHVDIVLMDVMMPEMNGIDATTAIRKIPKFKDLPIIALTAKAMADDRQACLDAGASDYLAKPINVDMLLSLMRVWMPR